MTLKQTFNMMRSLIRAALRRRGWELKRIGDPVRGYRNFIAGLRERGFRPGTIVDVGVNKGTRWLYGQFEGARLVLIEPLPERAAELKQLAAAHGADVYQQAAGAESGNLILHCDQVQPGSSSPRTYSALLMKHHARSGPPRTFADVTVPVRTLDATLEDRYPSPYLLKIDTEGFELEVLRGATRTLEKTAVVIVEMSVAPRYVDGYSVAELVAILDERGFRLFDLPNMKTLGHGGPLSYVDGAFVHRDYASLIGY